MIRRLIFDVDGTLITDVSFVPTIENTLKKLGLYSKENVSLFLEAISTYENVYNNYNKKDYLSHFGKCLKMNLNDTFLIIFFEELKQCIPFDNTKIKNSITLLSKEYELTLLTNYFKDSQMNRLNRMGIGDLFSECYGEELIKPNDEIYLKACGIYSPDECVMIGDNLYLDIEKAQSLGINTIWVNPDGRNSNKAKTLMVNRVDEITPDLIETMNLENKKLEIKKRNILNL